MICNTNKQKYIIPILKKSLTYMELRNNILIKERSPNKTDADDI